MAVAVALITVATFVPALSAGFVNIDDDRVVLHNPYLHAPFSQAIRWMWTTTFIGHYQPLTWMSLFADARAGGFAPFAFHLSSVLLHALAAALLFILLVQMFRLAQRRASGVASPVSNTAVIAAAAIAALFWSIHPLRAESVVWISERRDPLSVVFLLLALIAYGGRGTPYGGRGTPYGGRGTEWPYFASLAFLALSLLAKAWGMSFVIVLLAIDWGLFQRRAWLEKIPFAILGGVAAVIAFFAQRGAPDTMVAASTWGFGARLLQACYGLCFYVWKTIWPTNLAALYALPSSAAAMAWPFAIAAAIVVVVVVWMLLRWRTHRGIAAAAISYAAILAPVLGFAQSGPQLVADRYAYVAGIVISAVIAWALISLSRRVSVHAIALAGLVVVALYGVAAARQTRVWHDSVSLWSHAIASGHDSYLARFDLGQALRADGRPDDAIAEYRRALEFRPSSGNAWYVYGNALKAKGDLAGSEAAYQRAIDASNPATPEWMLAHVNLGNLYYNARRLDDAIAQYRVAVGYLQTLPPEQVAPEPYLYLGIASADRGDVEAAERALRVAAKYSSTRARAEQELARILRR